MSKLKTQVTINSDIGPITFVMGDFEHLESVSIVNNIRMDDIAESSDWRYESRMIVAVDEKTNKVSVLKDITGLLRCPSETCYETIKQHLDFAKQVKEDEKKTI